MYCSPRGETTPDPAERSDGRDPGQLFLLLSIFDHANVSETMSHGNGCSEMLVMWLLHSETYLEGYDTLRSWWYL
jgi:hypothetical protein